MQEQAKGWAERRREEGAFSGVTSAGPTLSGYNFTLMQRVLAVFIVRKPVRNGADMEPGRSSLPLPVKACAVLPLRSGLIKGLA